MLSIMFSCGHPAVEKMSLRWEECREDLQLCYLDGGLGFRGRLGKLKLYSLDAKEAEE